MPFRLSILPVTRVLALTGLLAGFVPTSYAQGSLLLDLAHDAARVQYASTAAMSADAEFEWDLGLMLIEKNGGDSTLFTGTMRSVGDIGVANPNHQVTAALGVRAFWLHGDGFDGQALGVGGELSARFDGIDRLVFAGYGYFAPQVLSFGDADELFEFGARAGYQVLRNGEVFVGYRRVVVDVSGSDVTADVGFHLGMKFDF